jgi:uncharacterized protein YfaS (alpha-2-macroglobulin family)
MSSDARNSAVTIETPSRDDDVSLFKPERLASFSSILFVPKRRRYVALEYHLPAGLEGIDFSLKTSPQTIAGKEQQCYPDWQGKQRCLGDSDTSWWWENIWRHIEYRDDRVFLFADTLEPGVYEYSFIAQATTPGEYRVPPTRVYEFYNPTSNAHNEGKVFKVIEK